MASLAELDFGDPPARVLDPDRLARLRDRVRRTLVGRRSSTTAAGQRLAGLAALVEAFFASIPHQWYTNNDIASYEGFYASVFYSYFAGLGLDIAMEDSSDRGEPIHLIAVEFSREARNLAGFDVEQA